MMQTMRVTKDYILALRHLEKRDPADEENVEGKIVIVTGANSGIGKATTTELAKRGATVVMACRQLERAQEALDDIRTKTDKGQLVIMELDLGDLASIRKFVEEFKGKYSELNILINNAGFSDQNGVTFKTKDGFERHFGTNHLGHFLLTNLLLDSLKKGAPSRVVSVASFFYETSNLNMDDLMFEKQSHGFGNLHPYGNSKLANMLFIKELATKLEGTGVTTYALCPGMSATNVFRTQPWYKSFFTNISIKLVGFSAEQGCQTTLLCALSKKLATESGKMYRFGKEWQNAMENLDNDLAKKLWTKSEQFVGLKSN